MSYGTQVVKIAPAAAAALHTKLRAELPAEVEWRRVPYARFSLRVQGLIVTCYTSGKLVVQGPDPDSFLLRWLGAEGVSAGLAAARTGGSALDEDLPFDRVIVGSDETGKGDYFGPLVVAAVRATPDDADWLRAQKVADSKTIADARAHRLAALIEERLDCAIVSLEPVEYNRRHAEVGNVNVILGELHARAIGALLGRHDDVKLVIVDRFSDDRHVLAPLQAAGITPPRVVQVPRAERHPAVAAASVVARAAFLDGLARCSDDSGTDLHKGAGSPVDVAARRVVAIGGRALLGRVAKLHFKNTLRAGLGTGPA